MTEEATETTIQATAVPALGDSQPPVDSAPVDGTIGLHVPVNFISVPARLGTWLEGPGGEAALASTLSYGFMESILLGGSANSYYQLDDDLKLVAYLTDPVTGSPVDAQGNPVATPVPDVLNGYYVAELVQALEAAASGAPLVPIDFDRDGSADAYSAFMVDIEVDGVVQSVAAVDIGADGTIDYQDSGLNGYGTYGLQDILQPNADSVLHDIAVGNDYSVTLTEAGQLLYRWGNAVVSPDDPGGDGTINDDMPPPAPTPPDVLLQDPLTADWVSTYTFRLADVTLTYGGLTLADYPAGIDLTTSVTTMEGILLNPIDSVFGFQVTDFIGAIDKELDGLFTEGWVGELPDSAGIAVADSPTDTFAVPARLGTWLEGIGGNFVKASTEHYTVMQAILSDQKYPGDTSGWYDLDDDLRVISYLADEDTGLPVDAMGLPSSVLVPDVLHGFYVKELVDALEAGASMDPLPAIDFDRDGMADPYNAYMAAVDFEGVLRTVSVVDIGNDGSIDYHDGVLNGFGTYGIADILVPNESTVIRDIAVSDDYSVTVKDDGKLLYRWGNSVKRPNDIRIDTKMDLPDEWANHLSDDGLLPLYRISAAELLVNHTVTNNPNDQIRPEDYENEAAIGQLPSFEVVRDPFDGSGYVDGSGNWVGNVLWVSMDNYYAGDGTFLPSYVDPAATSGTLVRDLAGNPLGYLNVDENGDPIGTVLRDYSLIDAASGSTLFAIGAQSSDLSNGFTEAWYVTMDREPFVAVLNDQGEYEIGPRWRLQPDKYGQDLPSVIIPQDPSLEPPVANGEEKYEVGVDTTTVINLLDWDGASPLALSAGWLGYSGDVSVNGVNLTDSFDVAYYVKGDIKPVNLYNAQLVLSFDPVVLHDAGTDIAGTSNGDTLVGKGSNRFDLHDSAFELNVVNVPDGEEDIVVLGYGAVTAAEVGYNEIFDFGIGEDALGLIGFGIDRDNWKIFITQTLDTMTGDVDVYFNDGTTNTLIATLYDVGAVLTASDFYFSNPSLLPQADETWIGTPMADIFTATSALDWLIMGREDNDTLTGLGGDDLIYGEEGDDTLYGGLGDDMLDGGDGSDVLFGGLGADTLIGGEGDDVLRGQGGTDLMIGGPGDDTYYVDNLPDVVVEGLGEGTDIIFTRVDYTAPDNVENIAILIGPHTITGNALDNRVIGNAGSDTLIGLDGNDVIIGKGGRDIMLGGNGNDTFYPGIGLDEMTGGAGADQYRFEDITDSWTTAALADVIHDFNGAEGDRIFLNAIDADSTTPGVDDAFTWIDTAAFSGTPGELRHEVLGANTYAMVDVNGDTVVDMYIRFDGVVPLVEANFVL